MMDKRVIGLFCLFLAVVFGDKFTSKNNKHAVFKTLVGKENMCVFNKGYSLYYNVSVDASDNFIQLETVSGLNNLTCNVDDTKMLLTFTSPAAAAALMSKLVPFSTYLTAGKKYNCDSTHTKAMMRKVFSWTPYDATLKGFVVYCQAGQYSHVFKDAQINFGPSNDDSACKAQQSDPEASAEVCLPLNANKDCNGPDRTLTFYENEYITITCSDCWLGLTTDIFMDVKMELWEMYKFSGGFLDIKLLGSAVVDFFAHYDWSVGLDNTIPVIKPTNIIDFWIGPVPVRIWFEVPVDVSMNVNFYASATASIGAQATWDVGDAYISWDWSSGWSHVSPNPTLTWNPVYKAPKAEFNSQAVFALIPSFSMHVDGFYSVIYKLDPSLTMTANGTSTAKTVCASMSYEVDMTVSSQLDISIPWFALHWDQTYGPKTIWDSGDKKIADACVKY